MIPECTPECRFVLQEQEEYLLNCRLTERQCFASCVMRLIDAKYMQVFTSDHALKLEWVPNWIAIIGSGYIGLEFSDVYTALGSEVTFIEVRGSFFSNVSYLMQECM